MEPVTASRPRPSAGGAALRQVARLDHLLGHGHHPARPRHRQRPLPDRARARHRPDRAARHGAASAARPEQCPRRLRRRPHPDVSIPTTSRSTNQSIRRAVREFLGRAARSQARSDRGRDHARRPRRRDQGHVHQGENPGHVGSRRAPCAAGARPSRASRRAGPLSHRDRPPRRRSAAGLGLRREGRHLHQHRPAGPDGAPGDAPPGEARQDWWILQEIARRCGLDWNYSHPRDVFAEMALDHALA